MQRLAFILLNLALMSHAADPIVSGNLSYWPGVILRIDCP